MAARKHRIAVLGLGMAVAPHAKSLLDLRDRVEVAAAYSPTAARRDAFAKQFDFPLADDLDAILADPAIDMVAVLTPPNTHRDIVSRAARAGKHILLEKPLEVSTARAVELVEACEAAGVTLGVVLQHRFRQAGRRLAALLRENALGPIVGCSTSIRLWRPQSYYDEPGRGTKARDGGGVLITQAIHTLDLMLSLAGDVAEVASYAATTPVHRMETEDMVCAGVRFANGALGVIDATTTAYPGYSERIEMIGEKGTAVLSGGELSMRYHDGRTDKVDTPAGSGGTGANPMDFPHDWHRDVIADFLDAVEQKRAPKISGREGLRVHGLIDALLESAASGQRTAVKNYQKTKLI
ncbi:MAG: Gfo/Idh/MocA family protein [Variibacter sp.]